jgi:hypothetical protein
MWNSLPNWWLSCIDTELSWALLVYRRSLCFRDRTNSFANDLQLFVSPRFATCFILVFTLASSLSILRIWRSMPLFCARISCCHFLTFHDKMVHQKVYHNKKIMVTQSYHLLWGSFTKKTLNAIDCWCHLRRIKRVRQITQWGQTHFGTLEYCTWLR